jgi:DNA-binding MarR family transcriptional regulator
MLAREQLLCFSLGVAMRRISRIYADALAAHDLTPAQLFVLTCLGQEDGQQPKDLAEKVFLDSSSVTGLIDRTERAGFLERRPDPSDRRALRIYLTGAGKAKLAELEPILANVQERTHREFFSGYSPEQVESFLGMLHQMRETVR